MTDWYLENRSRLEGQPKRTIANYVESCGFRVPERFDTLADARKSGKPLILRSEHVQDYDGVSGLLDSFETESRRGGYQHCSTLDEVREQFFSYLSVNDETGWRNSDVRYLRYCGYLDIDPAQFRDEVSFAAWEQITGKRMLVVGDDSVADRFHVMGSSVKGIFYGRWKGGSFDYSLGTLPKTFSSELIEMYESIRTLSRFDSGHMPLMEFVSSEKGEHYFLQYYRCRDFRECDFVLDRSLRDGEIEVPFVRGSLSEGGIDINCHVVYGEEHTSSVFFDVIDEASFGLGLTDGVWNLLRLPSRLLQFSGEADWEHELLKEAQGHENRSALFLPQVSMKLPISLLFRDDESLSDYIPQRGEFSSVIPLHVEADGRRGIVRRLD